MLKHKNEYMEFTFNAAAKTITTYSSKTGTIIDKLENVIAVIEYVMDIAGDLHEFYNYAFTNKDRDFFAAVADKYELI